VDKKERVILFSVNPPEKRGKKNLGIDQKSRRNRQPPFSFSSLLSKNEPQKGKRNLKIFLSLSPNRVVPNFLEKKMERIFLFEILPPLPKLDNFFSNFFFSTPQSGSSETTTFENRRGKTLKGFFCSKAKISLLSRLCVNSPNKGDWLLSSSPIFSKKFSFPPLKGQI